MTSSLFIPNEVIKLINALKDARYEAYLVGGAVRDMLLKRTVSDYDIATSATPDEMHEVFLQYKTFDSGIKHGTITVLSGGYSVEITTYRLDGEYLDNRHPSSVSFSKRLEDDLSRRDFTINAMAYDGRSLVDLFCGRDDLERKIIRCVGNARERFCEDGLRILRCIRFASQLDFSIDAETSRAIDECCFLLKNISVERIAAELKKLFKGKGAKRLILKYRTVFEFIMPSLSLKMLDKLNGDFITALALIADKRDVLALKLDKKTVSAISSLLKYKDLNLNIERPFIKRMMGELGYDNFKRLAYIKDNNAAIEIADEIIEKKECYTLSQLVIKGGDLIERNIAKGERVGSILKLLLDKVIDGEIENKSQALIEYAEKQI